jgi:hypothetical protein
MKQAELDNHGYPTDESIETIKNWPIPYLLDYKPLLEFIKPIFYVYGVIWINNDGMTEIVTGGWSGCEEAIDALQKSKSGFWGVCWGSSSRGGAYVFNIK